MVSVKSCDNQAEWDEEILERGGHPLQLWGWGEVKAVHNWSVERIFIYQGETILGAAQLLIRKLPFPLRAMVYVPRGPVVDDNYREVVLGAIAEHAKDYHKAVVVTIEPEWHEMSVAKGWTGAPNTILVPRTIILDLNKSEDELLADMSKKTRQYIRKSTKEDVEIRQVKSQVEIDACLAIYKETAERADFGLHADDYYYDIFEKLGDHSPVFAAFVDGQPVSFLWLAISQSTAFELYGGMNDEGQRLRANYALKWHVISKCREWGIERYDMNGLLNDGVSTFKQGFASHEDRLIGAYDYPLSPLYTVWIKGLPMAKKALQKMKRR